MTITAAVFVTRIVPRGTESPICCSIFKRLWIEKTVCCRSPVPANPTTTPYPISWLLRTPSMETNSFKRVPAEAPATARTQTATKRKLRERFMLERQQTEQKTINQVGAADRVAHYTLAINPDLQLRDLIGLHYVIGLNIHRTDHAA